MQLPIHTSTLVQTFSTWMKSGLLGNSLECLLFQIIFVTALFYLLSSSGEQYKPVEWFGKLSATGTAGFGDSAYGAIRFVRFMCQFLPHQFFMEW